MLPELLKLPALGITVYTYGVMLALGCAGGLYIAVRLAESDGVSREHIYHLAFWVLPLSLFGTKLLAIERLCRDALLGQGIPSALAILEAPGFYLAGLLAGVATSVLLMRAYTAIEWSGRFMASAQRCLTSHRLFCRFTNRRTSVTISEDAIHSLPCIA